MKGMAQTARTKYSKTGEISAPLAYSAARCLYFLTALDTPRSRLSTSRNDCRMMTPGRIAKRKDLCRRRATAKGFHAATQHRASLGLLHNIK